MSRATFGIEAGSPNYANGGVPYGGAGGRFAQDNNTIKNSRAELFGEPMQEWLPTWAPQPYVWMRDPYDEGRIQPEDAIAAGSGESDERNIWGSYYYGYYADRLAGREEDSSYAEVAFGADPQYALHDPSAAYFHFAVPIDSQPMPVDDPYDEWNEQAGGNAQDRSDPFFVDTDPLAARTSYYGGVEYR